MSNEPTPAPELTFVADAAKSNGDRLVIALRTGVEVYRDEINVNRDGDRQGFLRRLGETLTVESATLASLATALVAAADAADAREEATALQRQSPRSGARSQPTLLVDLASEFELFHSPDEECFASINIDNRRETFSLRSGSFRSRLARLFYEEFNGAPGTQAVQDAINVLSGKALYAGTEHPVFYRRATGENGHVYVDLGDPTWQAVEVSASGWNVVSNPPVRFVRNRAMRPLPIPQRGGCLSDLRQFINSDEQGWTLIAAWLLAAAIPCGPYPVCVLTGEQGTAKSTTSKILRAMIDPASPQLQAEPRDMQGLMVNAKNAAVLVYDNMSYIAPWMSDAFCRLSTGAGMSFRRLYSDDEEFSFNSQRPVVVNGIEELVTRSDLLDRCVMVNLCRLQPDQRRTEREFWAHFDRCHPMLLGALFSAIATGLANLPNVRLPVIPRMADFATWATACESQFCAPGCSFLSVYEDSRTNVDQLAIEASPVGDCLVTWLRARGGEDWEGTPSELWTLLSNCQRGRNSTSSWPGNARSLSDRLRRVIPNLFRVGVEVSDAPRRRGNRQIQIRTTSDFRAQCAQLPPRGTVGVRPFAPPILNANGADRPMSS